MMKRIFLIISLYLAPFYIFGQGKPIEKLMFESKKIRLECDAMKDGKKAKAQGYKEALKKQDTVIKQLQESVERYEKYTEYENDAKIYRFMSRTDKSVFTEEETIDKPESLPPFMYKHYQSILVIRRYYQCINKMKATIKKYENNKEIPAKYKKDIIKSSIESDIDNANDLLDLTDKIDMSSFSKEQTEFYHGLSSELSDILEKYIF